MKIMWGNKLLPFFFLPNIFDYNMSILISRICESYKTFSLFYYNFQHL